MAACTRTGKAPASNADAYNRALYDRGRALIEGRITESAPAESSLPDWVHADPETWFELSFYSKCNANRDDDSDRSSEGLAINLTYREYLELKATLAAMRGHIAPEGTNAGK